MSAIRSMLACRISPISPALAAALFLAFVNVPAFAPGAPMTGAAADPATAVARNESIRRFRVKIWEAAGANQGRYQGIDRYHRAIDGEPSA